MDSFYTASDLSKLTSYSKVSHREISMIQEKIMDYVSCTVPGEEKSCCIEIESDTPMTYYGIIESIDVVDSGLDYYPVVAVPTIISNSLVPGSGAEVSLTIDENDGSIVAIDIINPGSGYTDGETDISISHPEGTGFTGTVVVTAGEVSSVDILTSGTGYSPLFPEIRLENVGNGTEAVVVPNVNLTTGEIASVQVLEGGFGYSADTTAEVIAAPTSTGNGASLSVNVTVSPIPTVDPYNYYLFISSQDTCCSTKGEVNRVLSYFRSKGYTIRALVNEKTGNTIKWRVCWC